MEDILNKAIQSVQRSEVAFCKFLSPNDTKATNSNQSGYLISISAWPLFLGAQPTGEAVEKVNGKTIKWQDDFETPAIFTYYGSKGELRLTGFGRGFPFREEENVGDLFILSKISNDYYEGFVLTSDNEIEDFFAAVNISATETNRLIPKQLQNDVEDDILSYFAEFLDSLKVEFPSTFELSLAARNYYSIINRLKISDILKYPDKNLLNWLNTEYDLFKFIENNRYLNRIEVPFKTVEELVEVANTILNRRKSRAGKSLENQLSEVFNIFQLTYSGQAKTEGKKKPDFLFPALEAYHNPKFDESKLIMLASKTTCKDRWRQILNEADRIKTKHLFTLQQGISMNQLDEMYKHNVCLVVPAPYLDKFPTAYRDKILTLSSFIEFAKEKQS